MAFNLYVCWIIMHSFHIVLPEVYVSTECYGNALSISCEEGQRIKVIDDFFGVSSQGGNQEDVCQYHPGDCTVTNNRYSSLIHRFCEGKAKCTNFQVDRRYCGLNHTNYEQVEYECIDDKGIIDMCSTISMSSTSAYLATPNFPSEYPPSKDCMCTLWAASEEVGIKLEATHFVVKYDRPCQDWVEIDSGRHKRRICGAYRSTIISDFFQVTFHSDDFQGHQGAWMRFSSYPESSNVTIHVTCRPETYLPAKVIPPPATVTAISAASTITTTISKAMDPDFILSHEMKVEGKDEHSNKNNTINTDILDIEEDFAERNKSIEKSSNREDTFDTFNRTMWVTMDPTEFNSSGTIVKGVIINSEKNIILGKSEYVNQESDNMTSDRKLETNSPKSDGKIRPNKSKKVYVNIPKQTGSVFDSHDSSSAKPYLPGVKKVQKESTHQGVHGASFIVETIPLRPKSPPVEISDEVPSLSNKQEDKPESDMSELLRTPFHSKHITGVIIISICVGGIIVLIIVLGVLVCVNRSKKPKRSLSRQRRRNERLQERLNTLSFYDSIPLYDSIGHRGGVARAPVPFNVADTTTDLDLTASTVAQTTPQCQAIQSGFDTQRQGPFWTSFHRTPVQDVEFESSLYIDSSLYASLNRSFTSIDRTRSQMASPNTIKGQDNESPLSAIEPDSKTIAEPTEETANPVGVNIAYHCEEEDICTHV